MAHFSQGPKLVAFFFLFYCSPRSFSVALCRFTQWLVADHNSYCLVPHNIDPQPSLPTTPNVHPSLLQTTVFLWSCSLFGLSCSLNWHLQEEGDGCSVRDPDWRPERKPKPEINIYLSPVPEVETPSCLSSLLFNQAAWLKCPLSPFCCRPSCAQSVVNVLLRFAFCATSTIKTVWDLWARWAQTLVLLTEPLSSFFSSNREKKSGQ